MGGLANGTGGNGSWLDLLSAAFSAKTINPRVKLALEVYVT